MLAPLVLVAVATTQVIVASTTNLTPWRGGGFGMFSTLDGQSERFLRITATMADGTSIPVQTVDLFAPSSPLLDEALAARANPSQRHLNALAAGIAAHLAIEGELAIVPDIASSDAKPRADVADVHLSVWRIIYGREDGRVSPQMVAEWTMLQ
jgi:hypothetical protein